MYTYADVPGAVYDLTLIKINSVTEGSIRMVLEAIWQNEYIFRLSIMVGIKVYDLHNIFTNIFGYGV